MGMAVNDGHRVRSSAVNLGMDESFKIDRAYVFVQRLAVKSEFKDIVGRHLPAFARQRADTLSGGQAQRVAVARALAQRPRAMLADEPVASLDPEAAEDIMRLLRRLASKDGMPVVCVLHQPELARRYADRILGLRQGRTMFLEAANDITPGQITALYESQAA